MKLKLVHLGILALSCKGVVTPVPLQLRPPVLGVPNIDVFYGAYRDVRNTGSVGDYQCGDKTFDTHSGTDILVRNFSAMDSGVTVVAAADGMVKSVVDGLFDRNTEFAPASAGNHVILEHEDNFSTLYAHLKSGSIGVSPGQVLSAGTPIGRVGSSGSSNWPHLHFEVLANGKAVEPATGPCNGLSLWENQLPYQDDFLVIDAGVLTGIPFSLATLLEAPASESVVSTETDSLLFWVQTFNQKPSQMRFDLIAPNDSQIVQVTGTENSSFAIRYLGLQFAVPIGPAGQWTIRMSMNGLVHHTETFELVLGRRAQKERATGSGTISSVGTIRAHH